MEILFLEQSPSNGFLLYHRKHSLQIGYMTSQSDKQQSFTNHLSSTVKSDSVLSVCIKGPMTLYVLRLSSHNHWFILSPCFSPGLFES